MPHKSEYWEYCQNLGSRNIILESFFRHFFFLIYNKGFGRIFRVKKKKRKIIIHKYLDYKRCEKYFLTLHRISLFMRIKNGFPRSMLISSSRGKETILALVLNILYIRRDDASATTLAMRNSGKRPENPLIRSARILY